MPGRNGTGPMVRGSMNYEVNKLCRGQENGEKYAACRKVTDLDHSMSQLIKSILLL